MKCIELNPKYHNPYYNLGYLYKAQEKIDKAIEFYKKAIECYKKAI
jgi:tetratricopeptide (TPR) repeat protein